MSILPSPYTCPHCKAVVDLPHSCAMKELHKRMNLKKMKRNKKRGQMTWGEEHDLGLR